jgi:hypothetical protein
MLHGDWGFSFVSRMNVDTLILQRPRWFSKKKRGFRY